METVVFVLMILVCFNFMLKQTYHKFMQRPEPVPYITFRTCSLICSSSSFICTTIFCISA